jgi:alpha-beta hydrolase superfamily lysophospholipase
MKHSEGKFDGCGNRAIYFQYWEPAGAARAVILIVHGAGEHGGRYRPFAEYFTGQGYAVVALDHNGHGHSDGTPGHVDDFDDYLQDLAIFHRQVAAEFCGVPLILLGHSMGGLISSNYLLQHQDEFIGCILSGPAIKTDLEPGFLQMSMIRLLALVAPQAGALQLDANGVSRDPEEVRKYVEDPLVHHGKMSARKLRELFAGMHNIQAHAGEITLPMLMLHGGEDAMASPEGSRFLDSHIGSADKTLKIYPGLYHEIFNEPERDQVFADVLNWCEEKLAAS